MHRKPGFQHDEISDIDYIVYRPKPNRQQMLFEPFRGLSHFYSAQGYAGITRSTVRGLHFDFRPVTFTRSERSDRRKCHFRLVPVGYEPCIQVPCHTDMRSRVYPVRCKAYFEDRIGFKSQISLCRCPRNGIGIQHHYAVMRRAYAQFILGTYHSERLDTSDFRFLDLELRAVLGRKARTDFCQKHFLACRHIGSAADYLEDFTVSRIDLGHMQMIRIRMIRTFKDFGHHYPFKSSWYRLYILQSLHFKPCGSEGLRYPGGIEIRRDIFFKPTVRNLHIKIIYL